MAAAPTQNLALRRFDIAKTDDRRVFLIVGKRNSGKCFRKDVRVLMADGRIVTVDRVQVDDELMGDDGTPRKVLGLARGRDAMFEVCEKGTTNSFVVTGDHVLCLVGGEDNAVTEMTVNEFVCLPPDRRATYRCYRSQHPLQFPPRPDPIVDPWMYGCLLGAHGASSSSSRCLQDAYTLGSVEVRKNLLAGALMKDGPMGIPPTFQEGVAEDLVFVARSLGWTASHYASKDHGRWIVDVVHDASEYHFSVTPLDDDEYYGFEVDGNNRFLLADFTVTHNSQLTADLLFHKKHLPVGILMSSTEEATGFFQGVCGVPDTYIYSEWHPEVIDNIITRQKKLAKANKMRNCFIVLDDLAFDKALFNSKQMRELMFNGRHYGILLVITAQFLGDLPTYFRSNVDYVITCRTPGIQDRERLWKNFFGAIPTFHMFQAIMDNTTEDYHTLVLDNTVQSNSLTDCIFWYKAPLRSPTMRPFRIGCAAYHQFAKKRGRKDEDLLPDDHTSSPNIGSASNPKKPIVVVKRVLK